MRKPRIIAFAAVWTPCAILFLLAAPVPMLFGQASPFPVVQGSAYKFEKVAEGVYYATGGVGSNNVVIVNDRDVLLVDDGTTPATARAAGRYQDHYEQAGAHGGQHAFSL